ncbi:MBL fold metallo-hydrolase [Falsiroseomonas sp. HW251]|uniref:MBL fold metallo-hydrolase n=1 Tax=Falsiroseomonas sp. HW251 TaxID=3390998 RepID=UPI003D3236DC
MARQGARAAGLSGPAARGYSSPGMTDGASLTLRLPFAEPPAPGRATEVAPGVLWMRFALPFRLDHVNVYLLEDGPGWTVVDTGLGDAATEALWLRALDALLGGRPVQRIVATHFHPDHAGMAGWLCQHTGAPLLMSQTEYLTSLTIQLRPEMLRSEPYLSFYRDHGLAEDVTQELLSGGQRYLEMMTGLPRTFRRLVAGEALEIGGRRWEVLTAGGHAPEQVMLHCRADRLLLAADQIMVRISPNISVQAMDPDGDPLGIYIRSLAALKRDVAEDTLILPGHHQPFIGLHRRADELLAHHDARCEAILQACRDAPRTAAALVPVVFGRVIADPHQMGFAFSEALAHVNYLERAGRLVFRDGGYRTT